MVSRVFIRIILLSVVLILTGRESHAQLNITNTLTPAQLVQNVLLGTGVTVSNVTYTGSAASRGSFTCAGGCNLGLGSGIFLTTGNTSSPFAPASYHHSTGMGTAGDPNLDAIVAPLLTEDAAVLEFDFSVAADSVQFQYVFASEEYNDYVNTPFNDVFGFFISGPGITGTQNIALVPGTTTPVAINNVNNGGPYPGVASGPCNNCAYYVDNVGGGSVYFDGFTTVLTAKSAVYPCETYHIKLAIADVNDGIFDSGVFLAENSFSSLGQIAIFANGVPQQNSSTVYACQGDSVELCLNPSSSYSWSNNSTTQCIWVNQSNLSPSGVYSGSVYNGTGCFAFTTNINIQFIVPSATITPSGPTNLCPGQTVTLTANPGQTYQWSNGATTQSITVSTSGAYTVTVGFGPNCDAVSTPVNVTVGSSSAQITGVTSLCNGAATTLSANAGQSYLWSNGATSQNINVSSPGTYSVTVTQTGGCTATASVNVQVNPNPAPNITGSLAICQGQNTTLDAGAGYSGYQWSTGGTSQTVSITNSGTYTVTVTDANGCTGTTNASVVVNNNPVPNITGVLAFCSGSSTTLNGGAGYSAYSWNTGATTQNLNVTSGGNYTVTVTNALGCTGTATTAVTMNPLPSPNIMGNTSICQGQSTSLNAGGGFSSYLWNTGATTQSLSTGTAGVYTVTVTDANGCTNTDNQAVSVNPLPTPSITGVNQICNGSSTTFDAGAGFSTYQWSTGATSQTINATTGGTYTVTVSNVFGCTATTTESLTVNQNPAPAISGNTDICQGQSTTIGPGPGYTNYTWSTGANTQTISVSTAGNYTVTVTDANGCTGTTSAVINVNSLPSPAVSGPPSVCAGTAVTYDAGAGYALYQWNTGATTQAINPQTSGTYTVTVTDINGCTGQASATLTINSLPAPVITGINEICQGDNTTIDAGTGYTAYQWSTGSTSQTISVNSAGPFSVTVTDANGCTGSASFGVTVNPLPVPVITGVNTVCQGQTASLNAGGGYSSYQWSNGTTTQAISTGVSGSYTVTVTDNNGCSGSTSQIVTVNALPSPSISGILDICAGDNTTLDAGSGYSGYQWSNGSTTQSITTGLGGQYTVTVTDVNGCSGSVSSSVTVNPLPVPAITGVNEICQGSSTTFDAGAGYTAYLWSNGATTQTINPGVAGQYTVTVTDANGCSNTDVLALTVNPNPSPSITGNMVFCDGDNSDLNAGPGYASYQWSTGQTTSTINVTLGGSYSVTVTDANGCNGSASTLVTVNSLPSPVVSGALDICTGDNTTLDAGAGYAAYQWNTGATSQNINTSNAGAYTVTVTDINGCSGSSNVNVTVNPLPSPAITGINEVCQGTTALFDAGSGYAAYLWSNGATTQTINPGVAGQYTVTVTDLNGCSNTDVVNLTVNALPVPVISGLQEFCDGASSDITASAGFTAYSWNTGQNTSTINVTQAGQYTVTVTDQNGCSGSASVNITVNPLPAPQIAGPTQICDGTTATFDAGAGYSNYVWNNGSTTQTISTSAAGTYQVTVTDLNGCVGSADLTLTVNDLPSATLSGNNTICFGENTGLTIDLTGAAPFVIEYSVGNNPPVQVNSATNQLTLNVSPGTTTTYGLVSVTDANCPGSVSGNAQIVVNPLPEPLITGDLSICDGETTVLTATPGFQQYVWSDGSNSNSIITGAGGVYVVTVTDVNGCEGASPGANLVVNQVPEVIFTNDTSLTCEVPYVNFNNLSSYPPGSVFTWEFGDGSSSGQVSPSHIYNDPGTYTVTLTITTPAGCESQATQDVNVVYYPLPVADFITSPDIATVFNGKIEFVDRSQYAVSWHWKFGDGDQDFSQNTEHYYNDVGDFKVSLTVTSVAGCEDTHTEIVSINPFYIPNAFTPNGDGLNDYFFNAGYELDVSSFAMRIFSRWGDEVFASESINQTWNGTTPTGDPAPQGTYVYRVQVVTKGGKEHVFTGQVNLIR